MAAKYINLLIDFSFKKVFGSEPNKDLLIALLNEVFRGRKHIVDLTYNKNEYPGDTSDIGGAIFDLTCIGKNGERFLIEVQRSAQSSMKERMLFYAGRMISDAARKGKKWKYAIPEVYVIVLMDGFSLSSDSRDRFLHDICLCDRDTKEIFYEGLGFIYIELPNFVKTEDELETDLDRWLFVLKNMATLNKIPVYLRKPIFKKLFSIAEYSNLTMEEKEMYDVAQKRKWDAYSIMSTAVEEGMAKGMAKGRAEGMAKGRAEGRAEGMAEGEAKGMAEGEAKGETKSLEMFIVNGSKNGLTIEQLQIITGCNKDRIIEILKKNKLL